MTQTFKDGIEYGMRVLMQSIAVNNNITFSDCAHIMDMFAREISDIEYKAGYNEIYDYVKNNMYRDKQQNVLIDLQTNY